MHWPIFSLLLFISVVLQISAGRFFPFADRLVRPDFLALLALFFALYAPRRHTPLAAWIIGFTADLLSLGTPGAFAFSFGLLALLTLSARQILYADHAVARIILAFCWTFLAHAFSFAVPCLLGRRAFADLMPFLGLSFCIALYTAALTPVYYLLARGRRWFTVPISTKRL